MPLRRNTTSSERLHLPHLSQNKRLAEKVWVHQDNLDLCPLFQLWNSFRRSSVLHIDIRVLETQVTSSWNINLCKTEKVRKTESLRKKHTGLSRPRPLHLFLSSVHVRRSAQVLLDFDEFGSTARALLLPLLLLLQLENMYRYTSEKIMFINASLYK